MTVIEKRQYPQHRVCGEYVSNEVLPYFDELDVPVRSWQPEQVRRFRLHSASGNCVESRLPLGGFGLRRYTFDYNLYKLARDLDVRFFLNTTVRDVAYRDDGLVVRSKQGSEWRARTAIGSFGKRSEVDRRLGRGFAKKPSEYIGVKFYLRTEFPSDLVALYGFDGGYAGAVKVEDGSIDVAYLTTARQLRRHGGIDDFEERVLLRNPAFKKLLMAATRSPERRFTISNVSFQPKEQVYEHILMVGDAAGMIFPLCGNGMAMGVHGAKLAAEAIESYLVGKLDRRQMEDRFRRAWRRHFARRLFWARRLHPFVEQPVLSELGVIALRLLPGLLPPIIRRTHGSAFA